MVDQQSASNASNKYSLDSFYDDSTIFITGGTGFLGKLLVRKLISEFPKISKIYVLIRTKNGTSAENRIKEYCNQEIFNGLFTECPNFLDKIHGISGDCALPRLGLSEDDNIRLKNEVKIVFHGAANVKFNEAIKISLNINTQGVVELLNICKDMKNLKSVIQISTAFSHGHLQNVLIKEEVMDSELKYKNILQLVEMLNPETLSKITPALIDKWPNIYMLSKYLGEQVVSDYDLPVGIFRPGVVMPTYRDPVRGWTDNLYVVTGVAVLVLSGVVRCLKIDPEFCSYIIPADWCVNGIIAAAADVYEKIKSNPETLVYNYCSADNPLSWKDLNKKAQRSLKYPLKNAIWIPILIFCTTNWGYKIAQLFLHFLPAFVCDALLFITGRKPKFIKRYKKIHGSFENLVLSVPWIYETQNIHSLWDKLNSQDQERFPFHMPNFSWDDYFEYFLQGIGKYMMNQKPCDLGPARTRNYLLRALHRIVVVLLAGVGTLSCWKIFMRLI